MADDTGTATEQGEGAAQSQGDTAQAQGAAGAQAQGAAAAGDADDREALLAKIADLEKDNRSYRQARTKQANDAKEQQTLAGRVSELEQQLADRDAQAREQSLRLATVTAAQKLGYRNPDMAYRLLDPGAVQFAEDGTPRNVEKLLSDLAKAEPYLLTSTDFGGGQRGASASGSTNMNDLIRAAAGRR